MRYLNYFIFLSCGLFFIACGGGTSRGTNSDAYGNLQSYSSVDVGGVGSTLTMSYLQSKVTDLYCYGIVESYTLVDNSFALVGAHIGTDLCNANETYIQGAAQESLFGMSGSTNLSHFISNSAVESVAFYQIIYNTPGQATYYAGGASPNEEVSGLVIVPQGIPQESMLGVVLYYHPTIFSKTGVPSTSDNSLSTYSQLLLASVYASQGYIVIAPDYVGQGVNYSVMHPYVLYAQNNALSGLNMLSAARAFLNELGTIPESSTMNLYISSYSEGGAYALWASRMLQGDYASLLGDNNLSLKRTVGISGAYDLSNEMIPYAYDNSSNSELESVNTYNVSPGMPESSTYYLSGGAYLGGLIVFESAMQQTMANVAMGVSKSALASYAFVSFVNYNYTAAAYPLFFPNNNFFYMSSCVDLESYLGVITLDGVFSDGPIVTEDCLIHDSLSNLFINSSYDDTSIETTISTSAMAATNFLTNGESGSVLMSNINVGGVTNNSVSSFAKPVLNDPQIMEIIAQSDTWSFTTTSPISLLYLNYDSTVTNKDSINACSATAGVKNQSDSGMVTCLSVDNTQLYTASYLGDVPIIGGTQLPLMMDHSQAEFVLNLAALNQIKNTQ